MNIDPLDVAGINATILSVLIASLFAYGLFVFTTLQAMEEDVIREAERVNSIMLRSSYGLGAGWRDHLENLEHNRLTLLNQIKNVGLSGPPDEVQDEGQNAVRNLTWLTAAFPFPLRARPSPQGGAQFGRLPEPVEFANIEDARTWLRATDEIAWAMRWATAGSTDRLTEATKGFGRRWIAQQAEAHKGDPQVLEMVEKE